MYISPTSKIFSYRDLNTDMIKEHNNTSAVSCHPVRILPGKLTGTVTLPPGKSEMHRHLAAFCLAAAESFRKGEISRSDVRRLMEKAEKFTDRKYADDIRLTAGGALSLMSFMISEGRGSDRSSGKLPEIFCMDSGTTLRMLLPAAAAVSENVRLKMSRSLASRPLSPLLSALEKAGVVFSRSTCPSEDMNGDIRTFSILETSGLFRGGTAEIPGNISSQFITGLLYALPLTEEGGTVQLTSQLSSSSYVDLTVRTLRQYGVHVECSENSGLPCYTVKGRREEGYRLPCDSPSDLLSDVPGDWSAAAFWLVADAISGPVEILGADRNSLHGDKKATEFIKEIMEDETPSIDMDDTPDLFPALAVLSCFVKKDVIFTGIRRLSMKESDRSAAVKELITSLGGKCSWDRENHIFTVHGSGSLRGGTADSAGDHRIAMAAAVAASGCTEPVTITDTVCCRKSYPDFFSDFEKLGGRIVKL